MMGAQTVGRMSYSSPTHGGQMTRLALLFMAVNALLQAQGTPAKNPAANNPHLGNPQSIRSGMALYRTRCADCHGLDAGGYRGPDLTAVVAASANDERLFTTIRKGVPGTEMPPMTDDPDDDEIGRASCRGRMHVQGGVW